MLRKAKLFTLMAPAGLALVAATALPRPQTSTAQAAPSGAPTLLQAAGIRYVVAPTGNEARYLVREQLVGRDLPNDAVGKTSEVSGAVVIGADGKVIPAQSKITVGTSKFASDSDRRDGYVRRRLLESEQFPAVEIAPTALRGLPAKLPTTGTRNFQLLGNLTVRGVTRPTVWNVRAQFQGDQIKGTAATAFTFDQFQLTQPRVPVVLSVADTIRLEYDFTLKREGNTTR